MVLQFGRGDFLHRQRRGRGGGELAEAGNLAVGRIAAGVAQQQGILADGGQIHILVGQLAAHHAHIRFDCDRWQAAAVEDIEICLVMGAILLIQPFPVGVQAVAVLHRELAHPDQAGARPRIIPEFGLQVVDQSRELAIGADLFAHQVAHHFLVSHRQDHIPPIAVFEAPHLGVDLVPALGFLPDIGRLDHRHAHFLPADGVHLLAHDIFDPGQAAFRQGQVGEDACGQLADKTCPQQQLVAGDLGFGGGFAQGLAK